MAVENARAAADQWSRLASELAKADAALQEALKPPCDQWSRLAFEPVGVPEPDPLSGLIDRSWLYQDIPADLKTRLEECHAPWPSEADKELDEAAKRATIRTEELLERTPEVIPVDPPLDKSVLRELRRAKLVEWEKRTGGKRSHLYARRNGRPPIISKNQFYPWLHGDLPSGAEAARLLEAYLNQP
jgi:hypothetical protein